MNRSGEPPPIPFAKSGEPDSDDFPAWLEAEARQLLRSDIVADVAGLSAPIQEVSDEVAEVLLRPADVLISMQERGQFRGVALVLN